MDVISIAGAVIFALALVHTFSAKTFDILARRHPCHAGLFHLLGEVEVVFGFWAFILIAFMALLKGGKFTVHYVESRVYTEPLFVFVVMVVAASRPVLDLIQRSVRTVAHQLPINTQLVQIWLGLAAIPLLGSLVTEPAAMTLAALILAPLVFRSGVPEWLKYGVLGVLFVNVSIGGTLTSYAAPPVLMVASTWGWSSQFMFEHFGWKAACAVILNATVITLLLYKSVLKLPIPQEDEAGLQIPWVVVVIHLLFLAFIVMLAHYPAMFLGLFCFFLGYTQAYHRYQSPLILKEGLLVGFFLAGLVVLGGLQEWWIKPLITGLEPKVLFLGAMALTAVTDNAALTYLGSLVQGISMTEQYALVAGAVVGGGLTVIANAPNPAGVALLRKGFSAESIGAVGLFLGALLPTVVAASFFLFL